MCLNFPGKILKIEKNVATIDYGSEIRTAKIISEKENYKVGDFVMVVSQIVSEKVPNEQVAEWLNLLEEENVA